MEKSTIGCRVLRTTPVSRRGPRGWQPAHLQPDAGRVEPAGAQVACHERPEASRVRGEPAQAVKVLLVLFRPTRLRLLVTARATAAAAAVFGARTAAFCCRRCAVSATPGATVSRGAVMPYSGVRLAKGSTKETHTNVRLYFILESGHALRICVGAFSWHGSLATSAAWCICHHFVIWESQKKCSPLLRLVNTQTQAPPES